MSPVNYSDIAWDAPSPPPRGTVNYSSIAWDTPEPATEAPTIDPLEATFGLLERPQSISAPSIAYSSIAWDPEPPPESVTEIRQPTAPVSPEVAPEPLIQPSTEALPPDMLRYAEAVARGETPEFGEAPELERPEKAPIPADLLRSLPGGALSAVGGGVRGLGELNDALATYATIGIEKVLPKNVADFLTKKPIVPWYLSPTDILKKPGTTIVNIAEKIKVPEERRNLATDITEGVGQMAGQIASLLINPVAGIAMLAGLGADIQAQEAERAGATPGEKAAATVTGASVTALVEKTGLDLLLNRVPPNIKNAALRYITDISLGGSIEAAEEVIEGILHNLTSYAIYDPEAKIFEGLEREAITAGGAGSIMRAIITALTGTKARAPRADAGVPVETGVPVSTGQPPIDPGTIAWEPVTPETLEGAPVVEGLPPAETAPPVIEPVAPTEEVPTVAEGGIPEGPTIPSAPTEVLAKEPWEMTPEEFADLQISLLTPEPTADIIKTAQAIEGKTHKEIVQEALAEGKVVPEETLRSYPDLAPAAEVRPEISEFAAPTTTRGLPAAGTMHVGLMEYGSAPIGVAETAMAQTKQKVGKQDVIRRESIITPLLKDLDASLFEGRVKGRGALGFFRNFIEEVRVKKHGDLEVTAHEVAHLLDARFPEIRRQWGTNVPNRAVISAELKSISYDKGKVYEGFAEYVRLWMSQRERAVEAAPVFTEWFENWVATSPHGKALVTAQKGMHDWFAQTGVDRALSKIGEGESVNSFRETVLGSMRQAVSDDLHGIYRMERAELGGIKAMGPYEIARLSRASLAIIDGAMDIGHPVIKRQSISEYLSDMGDAGYRIDEVLLRANTPEGYVERFEYEGKGLKQILAPVTDDLDNFFAYAVGRSADELMRQGREKLFTRAEIDAMLALQSPEFNKAFLEYQLWQKKIVDFAQAKGIINDRSRALWQRMQFLPFNRVGKGGPTKASGGVVGNWKGVKRLTGGTQNLRPVMQNIIDNAQQLLTEALKNEARVAVADFATKTPGGGRYLVKIGKDTKPVKVDKRQIEEYVYRLFGITRTQVEKGNVPKEILPVIEHLEEEFATDPDFIRFWMQGQAPHGENVMAALRNGRPTFYEVADPLLYRSIEALNRPTKHWFVNLLGGFKRVGQSSITLSVDFMTANIARDTLMGGIMSRNGFVPFVDSAKGMKSRILKDQTYRDFIANGGGFASYFTEESDLRKHIERFYTQKGIDYRTVIDSPAKLLYFLETVTDSFEVATRLGEFKKAIERGEHPRRGAYLSREVSTDFTMRGDSKLLNFFYDTAIFFKAGVNGIDRLYRGLVHDPNRTAIAGRVAMLALFSMVLKVVNRDNPEYEDLSEWDKDTHWHFWIPVPWSEERQHFRFPKIWEVGAVASIAERSIDAILDKEPEEFAINFFRVLKDQFKLNPMPQAVRPIYEQARNKIGFIDTPIESTWMQDLQPFARAKPSGSKALRELGIATRGLPRELQVPPARAEALLRGYLNTWAMYGLSLTDAVFYDDLPDMRIDDYPVLRRFLAATPAKRTKHQDEFWNMLKEATEARRTMRHMDKAEGTRFIADEIEARYAEQLDEYSQLTTVSKTLSTIRAEMNDVIDGNAEFEGYTGAQKRKKIDELITEKNKLFKDVITDIEAQRKEGQ